MTGVKFDPSNFKALTLGNIFQMELHRFTADIDDIINESVQELKIENEIRKVEATWRKTDLILAKYQKNGVDRSYVLRAADEIKTELEDNLLNLQTMSSSRFVGSFADQVLHNKAQNAACLLFLLFRLSGAQNVEGPHRGLASR